MQTLQRDWTIGCIALANPDIEELWQVIEVGVPILIIP
jgi:lipoprotein-anchoring transpeptidase ErfK/SrfK